MRGSMRRLVPVGIAVALVAGAVASSIMGATNHTADVPIAFSDSSGDSPSLDVSRIEGRMYFDSAGRRWVEVLIQPFSMAELVGTRQFFLWVYPNYSASRAGYRLNVNRLTFPGLTSLVLFMNTDNDGVLGAFTGPRYFYFTDSSLTLTFRLPNEVGAGLDMRIQTTSGYSGQKDPYVPDGVLRVFDVAPDSGAFHLDLPTIPPADTTPPQTPPEVRLEQPSPWEAKISWGEPLDDVGVVSYVLVRDGHEIGAGLTDREYHDRGLDPRKKHAYSVAAVDAAGNRSPLSPGVSTTPAVVEIVIPKVAVYPSAPTAGSAFLVSAKVRLSTGGVETPIKSARARCRASSDGRILRATAERWVAAKGIQCRFAVPFGLTGRKLDVTLSATSAGQTGVWRKRYTIR